MLACALLCAGAARADKIVLKNGRKIIASNVVEDGDKVRYETSAGQMALPKSIVDHIEKGGLMPMMDSPAAAAASLGMEPPELAPTANGAEIDQKRRARRCGGPQLHRAAGERNAHRRRDGKSGGGARASCRGTIRTGAEGTWRRR